MKIKKIKNNLKSQWQCQKGFTMIELAMTIALMGIIAYVTLPRGDGLVPMSLDAAARKVKADIRYAQNLASTTGESHGFRVTGNSTYEIYHVTNGVVLSPMTHLPMQEDLSVDFHAPVFQQLNDDIVFNEIGKPNIESNIVIGLTNGNVVKQIEINQTTGYIRLL